ncbi:hypothetical protein EKN56_19610 [Limnobaculum zhutongyuii]|uniref:Uncharacterized protein n=1 Tax=Limnobaculum zhutongyuii TaxID=2498113 RepID=A0A411WQH2_9GAMM|nr:hypothetical protein [Limnobaculum zhutongyuii]QBH98406.1 hypothetical protein EKN56_19610 [Limnobaculum zhutongyuii]TQS89696.1 hypothetical protein ELQ32_04630 [Limnobaculum zhutongyuii]
MNIVPNTEKIIKDSKGLWLSGLFGSTIGWNPDHALSTYKNMFFNIIKVLLDDGAVRFCRPDDPLGKKEPYWKTDSDTIINYLQENWPDNVTDENDEELNMYFYEMPAILWRDDSGKYIGS